MIKTVSIDFWNTIVIAETGGEKRHKVRLEALNSLASQYDVTITEKAIATAKKKVSKEFDKVWFGEQRTLTSHDLVKRIVEILKIPAKKSEIDETTTVFMESLWVGPPAPADGVIDNIKKLAENYRLAIISDTMFSPGRVLRKYLDDIGILDGFDVTVFSDETGYSKPDIRAYQKVMKETNTASENSVHIGDIHKTDIIGAQQAGWKSILYTGVSDEYKDTSDADKIIDSWDDIPGAIADL
jgi:putative hydrolase of the HAD superfamily